MLSSFGLGAYARASLSVKFFTPRWSRSTKNLEVKFRLLNHTKAEARTAALGYLRRDGSPARHLSGATSARGQATENVRQLKNLRQLKNRLASTWSGQLQSGITCF